MWKKAREEEIYEYLEKNGYTSVKVLSEKLFSSESSIRRDLSKMESLGLVRRSYGGAQIITARSNVLPFEARSYEAVAEKRRIAQNLPPFTLGRHTNIRLAFCLDLCYNKIKEQKYPKNGGCYEIQYL